MTNGEYVPNSPERPVIYASSGMQPVLDGTLNGIRAFTCRVLVDRDTRQQHESPDAITYDDYRELVADSVQALTLRGLRTAVYCGIGDKTRQFASAIARRTIDTPDGSRPIKVGAIGNYLQSVKENTGTIRAFNRGRLEVLVASRMLETATAIRPNALVIATPILSKRVLRDILLNVSHADPEYPALTVVEMVELAAGRSGRSTYTTWDLLGEDTIRQGKQMGGYLDTHSDPTIFTLEDLPEHLRSRFEQVEGAPVLAVAMSSATDKDLEPIKAHFKALDEIAAKFAPHIPVKSFRSRIERAGLQPRIVYQEVDGEIVRVYFYSMPGAETHFNKHPIPKIAKPTMRTSTQIARELGVSPAMIEAVITELSDRITAQPLLQPEVLRERLYYDEISQASIAHGVQEHKERLAAFHAGAAVRRALKSAEAVYPLAEDGDTSLYQLALQAGVTLVYARQQLEGIVDLPTRQPEGGRPAMYVLKDEVEVARQRITPLPPPVHHISNPAIYARLHHRTPRAVDRYLANFPAFKRRQIGKGPLVIDRSWEAFHYAEKSIGRPAEEVPILWDDLPKDDKDVTPEQESYARAIQILYMDVQRLGAAAIMSRETAYLFVATAYSVATGNFWPTYVAKSGAAIEIQQPNPEPVTVSAVQDEKTAAATAETAAMPPAPAVESTAAPQESTVEMADAEVTVKAMPESEPQTPDPIWLDEYAAEFNRVHGGNVAWGDFERTAQKIDAEMGYDEVYGPYLTAEGRQKMDAYLASIQTAPEGWIRVVDCVSGIRGVSFQTVNDYLTSRGNIEGMGEFLVDKKRLGTARFVSPVLAAFLRDRFERRTTPAEPLGTEPVRTPPTTPKRAHRAKKVASTPESPQVAPPKIPAGARVLHGSRPLGLLDIAELTGREPIAVREAIKAARAKLGLKKFKTVIRRDRHQIETEHFSDPMVLVAIEDHLIGAHPADLAHRLNVHESKIHAFLKETGYELTEAGRIQGPALDAVFGHFAND